MKETKHKILYLVAEDWYFCSHRLSLAIAAKEAGFEVVVASHVQNHGKKIEDAGLRLIPLRLKRKDMNPFSELLSLLEIIYVYLREKPGIVHHVAIKPILYGTIAGLIARVPSIVNAFSGRGYIFTSDRLSARILKQIVMKAFRVLLNGKNRVVIFQNTDDKKMMVESRILDPDKIIIISGSGVDLNTFSPSPEPDGVPTIVLASRMLWDKGVGEFVAASNILKKQGIKARFLLAGAGDPDNPSSISREQLEAWHSRGIVEWLGHADNMPELFSKVHIVCLPSSYGEGIPKVLIEAAACGRPIVTTNAPGCREIVRDGENGLLVPIKNAEALASAIRQLIENPALRKEMGGRGRKIAEKEFSLEKVIYETLRVYENMLVEECGTAECERLRRV